MASSIAARLRLLPRAIPRAPATAHAGEWVLILILMLVGLVAHGFNMFNFPSFTFNGDEGIYTGQALAVLHQGRLSPYTYFYDHAPGGWIFMAAWMALSGGPHAFGSAIDSGRVLMLLLHLAMIHRLYRVAREFGCGPAPAALATLIFSLSPLAVFYQRAITLDTLMLFWTLISVDLLLDGQGRLSRVALSGFCFGLALLTKETAIFLLPAMLLLAFQERRWHHGRFAVIGWVVPMGVVTSWYLLYATLKGELLPAGFLGETQPHVSLMTTLLWQIGRGGGGMFNLDNQFWYFMREDWLWRDSLLVIGGIAATLLNLLRGARNRLAFTVALFGLLPLYYMARGGLVFNFYILFAIPFWCLNIAALLTPLCARMPRWGAGALVMVIVGALLGAYWWDGRVQPLYTIHASQAGHAAITWIRTNLPPQSTIVADDAFWPDLRVPGSGEPSFRNLHSHWKVGADPEVAVGELHNDWRAIDYLIMTPGLEKNFAGTQFPIALEAFQHAHPVRRWTSDGTVIELWQVDKTTNDP
jgi:4-amino-4-deoxy-L-arabinose transferase-like glycosyltransferase